MPPTDPEPIAGAAEARDEGISARHAPLPIFPVLVAPATGKEKNTFRLQLEPVACWRMDDVRFGVGLSFIRPGARREIALLAKLVREHPGAPLTVFGHADPSGPDDENKGLSGRRATAMYGLLIRDVAKWEHLFDTPQWSDDWGLAALQTILDALGHNPGAIDGIDGPKTQAAFRLFQGTHQLTESGRATKETRAKMFEVYMDFLARPEFRLRKSDFLTGGTDAGGKGDFQGCGEFNAIIRASQKQLAGFAEPARKTERDLFNSPNRRILILLFRPGTLFDANRWPCPRATEGVAGCRKRFWSDHEARRAAGPKTREYKDTLDTFACRFYDRMAGQSPCENPQRRRLLRIFLMDEQGKAIKNEKYTLEVEGVLVSTAASVTNGWGMLEHEIDLAAKTGVLKNRLHTWKLEFAEPPPHSEEVGVRVRLANLGFVPNPAAPATAEDLRFALRNLQKDAAIDETGDHDQATIGHLDDLHRLV